MDSSIPQPKPRPLLGNARDLDALHPVQSMMRLAAEHGPLFRLEFPGRSMLVVSSFALVDEVSDEKRFDKLVHMPLQHIRDFAGDGLFTAHTTEPNWGRAHRILMPAFGLSAMRNYFDAMIDIADQMLTKWERLGSGSEIDVVDNMTRLTLDTIALCGFGYRFNSFYQSNLHPFIDAMVRSLAEAGARSRRLPLQTKLHLIGRMQYTNDISFMNSVVDELIGERKRHPEKDGAKDLLSLMLSGRDPQTGEGLDDLNIRYQMVTFLIAGHETTSGLLSFATHLLLAHPEVLQKAQAEADRVLGGDLPRYEQLPQLGYIDQVLRESLRLWPTAPAFAVQPREDTTIGGSYFVEKGQPILILTPMLHRDPAVWGSDFERFDPERFAPAARDQIPQNAYKPFGNGQRACIGRPFAMQEATLVLAMMLQRFEVFGEAGYQLAVKETLTLKPEGLKLRVKRRAKAATTPAVLGATPAASPAPTAVAIHATPLLVLFGSNSGSSEAFARRIANDASLHGYAAQVAALDDYAEQLPRRGALVVVTASYNGQPPDNARRFCTWLEAIPEGALDGLRYAVFGCGNRDWSATYQAIPTRVDHQLAAAGATRLVPRGEADARADFFGDFENWYGPLWPKVDAAFGVESKPAATGSLYQLERIEGVDEAFIKLYGLSLATITESRELVDLTSPFGRSKRHVAIKLPEGVSYSAGDYLVVMPRNRPDLVERAARRFELLPSSLVRLRAARPQAATLPTDRVVSVGELLGTFVELAAPATQKQLQQLLQTTRCPPEKVRLEALVHDKERYEKDVLKKRLNLVELLEEFPAAELTFGAFLEMLPPLKTRQYSISSSPLKDPTTCSLTVAVVDAPAWSGKGRFRGACSSHLAQLKLGDQVAVTVRSPNTPFHPPADLEKPIVMACAGTGLAPFRGFLEERALRVSRGERAGPALLFFGCDHPDVDLIYKEQLGEWERQGVVKVLPAFFRQPEGEVTFVQHRLWKERAQVKELLQQDAVFFVCGDGARMAPAVRETLQRIYEESTGCTPEDSARWLAELEASGRYVADVFG